MPAKYEAYLDSYSAALRTRKAYDAIMRDVLDERQQLAALQQLIASERNTLAQLEGTLVAQNTEQGVAGEILKARFGTQQADAQRAASARAAGAAATAVPRELVALANELGFDDESREGLTPGDANKIAQRAMQLLSERTRPMTEQAARAAVAYVQALPGVPAQALQRVESARDSVPNRPTRGPGQRRLSPEEAAQRAGEEQALEAVYHSSKLGYVGAFDGEAIADKRRTTTAEGTSFDTEDDAFVAYLGLLEDGVATAEELAALTDATGEQAEADFRLARRVYSEAKAQGAYQNRQRKYFDPSWLSQSARVAGLEAELVATTPETRRTATQETARRLLQQQGIDPDDKYLQFRGTPKYDYYNAADRVFGSVDEIIAATGGEKSIANLLQQYETSGVDWTVEQLAAQLGKTMSGDELVDAMGFALALDRQTREGVKPVDRKALQAEERARIAAAEEASKAAAAAAEQRLQAARQAKEEAARLAFDPGFRKPEQAAVKQEREAPEIDAATKYARLRAEGLTQEQARERLQAADKTEAELEAFALTGAEPTNPELAAEFTPLSDFQSAADIQLDGGVIAAEEVVEQPETASEARTMRERMAALTDDELFAMFDEEQP